MQGMNRKKLLFTAALAGGLATGVWAMPRARNMSQAAAKANGEAAGSAGALAATRNAAADVRAGTKVSAALESTLDARTAKPGDRVVARVTKNVKQHGRVVIHKGDRLIGRVTQVHSSAGGKAGSSIAVAFNQLESGGATTQLNAVLKSVFPAQGASGFGQGPSPLSGPMPQPAPMGGPAGGGLLGGARGVAGGIGSTVGSTVGGVASTAGGLGSTVGGASQASLGGNGSAGLLTPMGAIHLGAEGSAQSASGINSVLSTRHGNMRLNSGTQLQFRVAAQGHAESH
jgi:phenylpyruvate tautomerase PptA (4-oxalocrotonate tautomerase family)